MHRLPALAGFERGTGAHKSRHLLHMLRQRLPEPERFVEITQRTLHWRENAPWRLDIAEFEVALGRGELQAAVDLYRGDLLPGCYDEWIAEPRERLRQQYLLALEQLARALEGEGNYPEAILCTCKLQIHDPLYEETCRLLMRLHAARGQGSGRARLPRVRDYAGARAWCRAIGADGRHSTVAQAVGAEAVIDRGTFCCAYYSYFSGVPTDRVTLYPRPNRFAITFPTNDDLTVVMVEWPREEFHAFRADIEGSFFATLDLVPELAERVRAGKREERFTGTVDLPNFQRKAYGPGWALAGDALSHKDPILAQGVSDAFHDAVFLAEAIHAGLSGSQPMDEALAEYERRHLEASMPLFELTCEFATLQPPSTETQQLLSALIGNQEAINQFIGIADGTVPLTEFYAPENIARLTGVAA